MRVSPNRKIPLNAFNLTKIAAISVVVIINITEFIVTGWDAKNEPNIEVHPVDYTMDAVFLIGSLTSLVLLLLQIHYGVQSSPAQFVYFFSSVGPTSYVG